MLAGVRIFCWYMASFGGRKCDVPVWFILVGRCLIAAAMITGTPSPTVAPGALIGAFSFRAGILCARFIARCNGLVFVRSLA